MQIDSGYRRERAQSLFFSSTPTVYWLEARRRTMLRRLEDGAAS
jgi:hypothetical protein